MKKSKKGNSKSIDGGKKLVLIEWVDSHYRPGWTTDGAKNTALPLECLSVGWIVHDGKEAKVISSHITIEKNQQRCGDMTIPTAAILHITEVS